VSLRWTNRLALALQVRSCQVQRWRAGWSDRPTAVATSTGHGAGAIASALDALRAADGQAWTTHADLTGADESVHQQLLSAGSRRAALDLAHADFAAALGSKALHVQVHPLPAPPRGPHPPRWLGTAVHLADLALWQQELTQRSIALGRLRSALLHDLTRLHRQAREPQAVAVLLREEGASLVRLERGAAVALAWEHLDPTDKAALDMRLRAFIEAPGHRRDCVVYLQAESQALCRYRWDEQG